MTRKAALVALLLMLAACKPAPEPLLVGVFAGDLPCADCPGLATRLTLVRKDSGWAEGRYLMVQTYRERNVPPLESNGMANCVLDTLTSRASTSDGVGVNCTFPNP